VFFFFLNSLFNDKSCWYNSIFRHQNNSLLIKRCRLLVHIRVLHHHRLLVHIRILHHRLTHRLLYVHRLLYHRLCLYICRLLHHLRLLHCSGRCSGFHGLWLWCTRLYYDYFGTSALYLSACRRATATTCCSTTTEGTGDTYKYNQYHKSDYRSNNNSQNVTYSRFNRCVRVVTLRREIIPIVRARAVIWAGAASWVTYAACS